MRGTANGLPKHEPDDEEIARVCAEIRARWSEREHRRRAGCAVDPEPYEVPTAKIANFSTGAPGE